MEDLEQLEIENEALEQQVSIEEKKALIAEAKQRYGNDWKRHLSFLGNIHSGLDWEAVKFKLGD